IGLTLHDCGHGHTHGSFSSHGHSHGGAPSGHNHKKHDHSHGDHDHSHGDHGHFYGDHALELDVPGTNDQLSNGTKTRDNEHQNVNVRAAFIHVLGDLLQSLGVLIAAFIIYFKPEYAIADPICTFIFSFIVLFTTLNILRDAISVLMEATPKGVDFKEVKSLLEMIEGVKSIHSLHIWSLTMGRNALSVHIAISSPRGDDSVDPQVVLEEAARILEERYNLHNTTIQIENYSNGMKHCLRCKEPKD
ncbi:proton-coupled zinc antiporter SLC30A2-like, partial [Saccoglossus kowalevskii]|uniref:Zinc transporter 2-like n=1 Tax=Saccoglossus kowalevskii TaxID=10224 RepID=A0ABM0M1P1_SACKO